MINENGGKMPDAVGIPEDQLRQAARGAVCKINIDSDLRLGLTAASVSTWHSTRNISTRASTSPTAVSSFMTSSLTRLNASSARKAKLNRMSCKKGIDFFCAIW